MLLLLIFFVFSLACTSGERSDAAPRLVGHQGAEAININTASSAELMRIPFVGEELASKIISHREKYGRFRRTEQLMLLNGISDKRFRQIRHLVRVDQ